MCGNNKPIGVFDSGVGGLTVVKELFRYLPAEEIVYFGDTARVPYGTKSRGTVTRFAFESTGFLMDIGIKMLVIACNTVSASSLREIKANFDIPVQGVIHPGAGAAVKATKNKKIGVIGTERTISSGAYVEAIRALDESIEIYSKACPLFVPLVEEGWLDTEVTYLTAIEYLEPLKREGIDTLVLACTHYPLLKGTIRHVMGKNITLIDSAMETAKAVKETLKSLGLERKTDSPPSHRFYVSDNPEKFVRVGERFLNKKINSIEKIDIEGF